MRQQLIHWFCFKRASEFSGPVLHVVNPLYFFNHLNIFFLLLLTLASNKAPGGELSGIMQPALPIMGGKVNDMAFLAWENKAWLNLQDFFSLSEQEQFSIKGILQLELDTATGSVTATAITPHSSKALPGIILLPSPPGAGSPLAAGIPYVDETPILQGFLSKVKHTLKTTHYLEDSSNAQYRTRHEASVTPIPAEKTTPVVEPTPAADETIGNVFADNPFSPFIANYINDEDSDSLSIEVNYGDILTISPSPTTKDKHQPFTLKHKPRQVSGESRASDSAAVETTSSERATVPMETVYEPIAQHARSKIFLVKGEPAAKQRELEPTDITDYISSPADAGHMNTLQEREKVAALSDSAFSQELLASLEASRFEAGGPEQDMAELEVQYHAYLKGSLPEWKSSQWRTRSRKKKLEEALEQSQTGSRSTKYKQAGKAKKLERELDALTNKDMLDLSDEKLQGVLKGCCKPELARLIPDDMLDLLKNWLESPHSVLESSQRELIKVLSTSGELRKVIKGNPHLASGCLYNMNGVVFRRKSRLPTSTTEFNERSLVEELNLPLIPCDYSDMSFKGATFPDMYLEANFRNCDMSYADFSKSSLVYCDFYGADFTAACLSECVIRESDFHKATLVEVDFAGIEYLTFSWRTGIQLTKTVDLFSQALAEYSRRSSGDQATLAIRTQAEMLLTSQRQEEVEAAYDELMRRGSMNIHDFWLLGHSYLDHANRLDEDDQETKELLARRAVACFQKGWRVTSNTRDYWNHNVLYNWAIVALAKTGPAFDWRSLLEDISRKSTKDVRTLTCMAQTLAKRQEGQDAIDILLQLVSSPESFDHLKGSLEGICETAAEAGQGDKECLTAALIVLESATTLAQGIYDINNLDNLDYKGQEDIFAGWLYQIDLLLHFGHRDEASKVALEMEKAIPGSLELFSEEDYEKLAVWKKGAWMLRETIKKIRATGVVFTEDEDLIHSICGLSVSLIRSKLVAELESGIPALCSQSLKAASNTNSTF